MENVRSTKTWSKLNNFTFNKFFVKQPTNQVLYLINLFKVNSLMGVNIKYTRYKNWQDFLDLNYINLFVLYSVIHSVTHLVTISVPHISDTGVPFFSSIWPKTQQYNFAKTILLDAKHFSWYLVNIADFFFNCKSYCYYLYLSIFQTVSLFNCFAPMKN